MGDKWNILYNFICKLEESNNNYYQEAKKDDDIYRIIQFEAQHRIYLQVKDHMIELMKKYD